MHTRVRKIAGFFAFNIMFFALYLNFIDRNHATGTTPQTQTAGFGSSILNTQFEKSVMTRVASIK